MVKFYDSIPPFLQDWALSQSVFFTASAPLVGQHVNVSPKGLPSTTFTIFDPNHCAYIDATGSGIETVSHVRENGRVTIMFCSFETLPRILRFFCRGRVVEWDEREFEPLLGRMGKKRVDGGRAIIVLDVWKVQTSCGYGVPLLDCSPTSSDEAAAVDAQPFLKDRKTMGHWASNKIEKDELQAYHKDMNAYSLDGLPGLLVARRNRGQGMRQRAIEDLRAWVRRMWGMREAVGVGVIIGISFMIFVGLLRLIRWH
ncbi:MAG: hypothetical protein M1812_001986 [Candelaria pacifica]|nr:MAG: hypothetical protein M1812_001986 [Candelaria pacifica]